MATNVTDVDPTTLEPVYGDLMQKRAVSEPSEAKYENYNATIDWNTGPFTVLSTTSYGHLELRCTLPMPRPFDLRLPVSGSPMAKPSAVNIYEDNNAGLEKFTQEIRLSSPVLEPARMAGGRLLHP